MQCGSYRPIPVLSVDCRLFTSIMAKRFEKFLPILIHNDQTGFIHQRHTQDNIRTTLHIIDHIQKKYQGNSNECECRKNFWFSQMEFSLQSSTPIWVTWQLLKLYKAYMKILLLGLRLMDICQIVLLSREVQDKAVHVHHYSLHYIWSH